MDKLLFSVLTVLVVITDFLIAFRILKTKKYNGRYLAMTMILAGVVNISYDLSILTEDYFIMSLFSGIYFSCISVMLMYLLIYTINLGKIEFNFPMRVAIGALWGYTTFDVVVELINPFKEIAMHYVRQENSPILWSYSPAPLYQMHLGFSYLIILLVFAILVYRSVVTPSVYRTKYLNILWGILFVVAVNAIFLFVADYIKLDYSILFYSVIGFVIYANSFHFSERGMVGRVRQTVLDELEHPIVLFDDENHLAMCNAATEFLIPVNKQKSFYKLEDFIEKNGFNEELLTKEEDFHFQWNYCGISRQNTYRVDMHILKDKKQRVIGKLFTFTDNSLETDILTGFHSYNSFERFYQSKEKDVKYPAAVAICDINKLSIINREHGEEVGDRAIQIMAALMKKHCPEDSYFARYKEANLLVISSSTTTGQMRGYLKKVREELKGIQYLGISFDMQSAISEATEENPGIMAAAEIADNSMRARKLMDGNSAHSSLLDSLAQTLRESDSTTEEHVKRTRDMGERLGIRMGFSDQQLSDLALLCLLHDIGKLGVPLEILNKPGKLNDAEWDVMKSHTDKGYRIAKASKELERIADLILHHHECWDGKGYPDGLSKESIPLLSRIIAVVDTYDAMTNDRPYRKAISEEEARAELKRCAGRQFDPSIVSEFLQLLDQIEEEKKEEKVAIIDDSGSESVMDLLAGLIDGSFDENETVGKTAPVPDTSSKSESKKDSEEEKSNRINSNTHAYAEYVLNSKIDRSRFDELAKRKIASEHAIALGVVSADMDDQRPRGIAPIKLDENNVRIVENSRYVLDEDFNIIEVDDNFETITGYRKEDIEIYHLTQWDLIPVAERENYQKIVGKEIEKNGCAYIEHRILRKDGGIRLVYCYGKLKFDSVTRKPRSEIVVTDLATMTAMELMLQKERGTISRRIDRMGENMRKDSMTGILNHEAFVNDVEGEILQAKNDVVLIILDVDYFKSYNDSYGHLAGDKMLTMVAQTMASMLSPMDYAGRLGGDEFACALILPKGSSREEATHRVETIFNGIMSAIQSHDQPATISMGAALSTEENENFNLMYQKADKALYIVKENGRKNFGVYKKE